MAGHDKSNLVNFVHSQIWSLILQPLHLTTLIPSPSEACFSVGWRKALRSVPKEIRKGLNSLIILVTSEVWKHRNSCVFENARPSTSLLLQTMADEISIWGMAGATKLQELLVRSQVPTA
ncbi:hypothetical protein SETIT_2G260800v2 [Setaria italica]|uniref:Uncharacterized protein n=1 Tax=Setaria italica TaxID=4555 RepID=A0A368Q3A7_SETIT|nr:hypothetical protein SETIT_2G260800v2 [Setaria italica]